MIRCSELLQASYTKLSISKCGCFTLFRLIFCQKISDIVQSCSSTNPITPVVLNNCGWWCSRHQISQTEENIPLHCLLLLPAGRGGRGGRGLHHCGYTGCPGDTSSLAFVFLPSVLGQRHTVTVRQNRGYANTRGRGRSHFSLGNALVLKKLCSCNSRNAFLEKKAERLRLNVTGEKSHSKDVGPVAQDRNVNDVRVTSRFYCEIVELMWRWKSTDCIGVYIHIPSSSSAVRSQT